MLDILNTVLIGMVVLEAVALQVVLYRAARERDVLLKAVMSKHVGEFSMSLDKIPTPKDKLKELVEKRKLAKAPSPPTSYPVS